MGNTSNYFLAIFRTVLLLLGTIYVGGAVPVKGAPVFQHIDRALGTTVLMTTYHTVMFMLKRKDDPEKEDPFTKGHKNIDQIIQKNVE